MKNNILIYIGIGNLIIGLIVLFVLIWKKEKTKGFLLFLFILLCPVIAPGFLLISWCLRKLFHMKEIDLDDLSFHTDKLEMITGPEFEKEIDVVPIEEVLLISNNHNKRRVILDILKEDYNNSLTAITSALESEDSETSHYVATIITDVKSEFKSTVQKMQESLNTYQDDVEICCLIIDYIDVFLKKNVLTEIEEMTYIKQYVQLMEKLYTEHKETITGKMYKSTICYLLKVKNASKALIWGERAIAECPNDLEAYKGVLKLYFEIKDKNKFFNALNKMKSSNVQFDHESMELVRFYQV